MSFRSALRRGFVASFGGASMAADRVDDRFRRRSASALTPGHPGVVPAVWATAKLTAVALVSPVAGLAVTGAARRNTGAALRFMQRYPDLLRQLADPANEGDQAIAQGTPADGAARVIRAPAAAAYFVSSDLHRCIPGTVDWVRLQNTGALYAAALDFYADRDWSLVENGDVEDFWLVGGSTYGVVYDIARLAAGALGGANGRRAARVVAAEQLRRIVANNRPIYDRIDRRFHRYGRYIRLVGNHDDVFLDPAMVGALAHVHAGIQAYDFLLLGVDDPDGAATVGVITHGHHTDAWNAPYRSALGKFGTWLGSALLDAPVADNPGVPDVAESERLLGGDAPDLLTRVGRRLGATRDLLSLDEVYLFDHWRRTWQVDGDDAGEAEAEPWLVFGHTHVPLSRPIDPETGRAWNRYFNSGSGIFFECVTGVEWDGRSDPRRPTVHLVAWRYADRDPDTPADAVVAWDGDRAIVREVLDRVAPGDRLQVVAHGHDRASATV